MCSLGDASAGGLADTRKAPAAADETCSWLLGSRGGGPSLKFEDHAQIWFYQPDAEVAYHRTRGICVGLLRVCSRRGLLRLFVVRVDGAL